MSGLSIFLSNRISRNNTLVRSKFWKKSVKPKYLLALSMDMNSEVPKWVSPGHPVCFSNRSEEASQNETKEKKEAERERCKRPRKILDSEGGVEEFLVLLDRIEETKKELKSKRMNFSVSNIIAGAGIDAVGQDQTLMAMPGMQQPQGLSDAVHTIAYNKSGASSWKPSFQWEDFNISNSRLAQTDLSGGAAAEKNKVEEGCIQKSKGFLKTRSFLDGLMQAECSHDHPDDVENKKEEEDGDGPPKLELQLFPI